MLRLYAATTSGRHTASQERSHRPMACTFASGRPPLRVHEKTPSDVLRRVAMSWIASSRMTSVMTATRCATNGSLRWHARLETALCEAHPTTSPTLVACVSREGAHGLCQQDGG